MPRPVIQSFKKVLNFVPASFAAGFNNQLLVIGRDGITADQSSNIDPDVPTGSIVKFFEIQFCVSNIVSTPIYINCTIQYKDSGQSFIDPDLIGGDNARNQTMHMDLFTVGANQNSTHKFKFKIPKQFQRVRAGRQWSMTWRTNGSVNQSAQIIYKFYR